MACPYKLRPYRSLTTHTPALRPHMAFIIFIIIIHAQNSQRRDASCACGRAAGPSPLTTTSSPRQNASTRRKSAAAAAAVVCAPGLTSPPGRRPLTSVCGASVTMTRCASPACAQLAIICAPPSIISERTPSCDCRWRSAVCRHTRPPPSAGTGSARAPAATSTPRGRRSRRSSS